MITRKRKLKGLAGPLAAALAASACAAVLAGAVLPAHAAARPGKPASTAVLSIPGPVPGGFASWRDLMAVQNRLDRAADRITAEAAKPGNPGFGSIVVSDASRSLRLYWKGQLPSPVRGLVDRLRPTAPVQVLTARYTAAELEAQALRMARQPAAQGVRVTQAAPQPDASGIEVMVDGSTAAARQLPAIRTAGVPVTITVGRPTPNVGRWHDTKPYWGGAAWENTAGGLCSTGFAVNQGGITKMLTAGHCASNGDTAWTGTSHPDILAELGLSTPGQTVAGYVEQQNTTQDTELIYNPSAGSRFASGLQYVGNPLALNNVSETPVTGWVHNYVGDYVFTDGALSGLRTDSIQVTGVNVAVNYDNVTHIENRATALFEDSVSGNGDSGGPVVSMDSSGSGFLARGIITAGVANTSATCTGIQDAGRTCSWMIDFESIGAALATYNATIVTG